LFCAAATPESTRTAANDATAVKVILANLIFFMIVLLPDDDQVQLRPGQGPIAALAAHADIFGL
jgi:hypothetical protein